MHAACANLDNVNLRWKCRTCVGALKPGEKEELDRRLGLRDWVEESDDSELEEEEKTEIKAISVTIGIELGLIRTELRN